jgi:hypothetical protein
MVYKMHDSKRTADHSRGGPQETSGRGQAYGTGVTLSGVNFTEEGTADFLLYSAGHRNGDREVREVIRWKAGLPAATNSKQTLTSLPGLEEGMAIAILPALCLHFTHRTRRPGEEGR